eukprot:745636-Hanusia_phi.AAC.2
MVVQLVQNSTTRIITKLFLSRFRYYFTDWLEYYYQYGQQPNASTNMSLYNGHRSALVHLSSSELLLNKQMSEANKRAVRGRADGIFQGDTRSTRRRSMNREPCQASPVTGGAVVVRPYWMKFVHSFPDRMSLRPGQWDGNHGIES